MPEIATDSCMGCGLCVKACTSGSLQMVWDFATLVHPEDCASCGECMDVCPHGVIEMKWIAAAGSAEIGRWRDQPEAVPLPQKHWLWGWLTGSKATATPAE